MGNYMKNRKEVIELLKANSVLNDNLDIDYLASEEGDLIDIDKLRESIEDYIRESVDVIYYSEAIKYLAENDASLQESLELASDLGYTIKDINSELLATLLLQLECQSELSEVWDDIESLDDVEEQEAA